MIYENKDFSQQNISFEFWQENSSTKTELRGENMPSLVDTIRTEFTPNKYHKYPWENIIKEL